MKVGDIVRKRWGKIEPEEQGATGLILSIVPGEVWKHISVAFPFGIRYFRETEIEVINES